jgi:hypothetical protein
LAAKLIHQKKIKLPKQSMKFIDKNKQAIEQLPDSNLTAEAKRKIRWKRLFWRRYDSKRWD